MFGRPQLWHWTCNLVIHYCSHKLEVHESLYNCHALSVFLFLCSLRCVLVSMTLIIAFFSLFFFKKIRSWVALWCTSQSNYKLMYTLWIVDTQIFTSHWFTYLDSVCNPMDNSSCLLFCFQPENGDFVKDLCTDQPLDYNHAFSIFLCCKCTEQSWEYFLLEQATYTK